MSVSQVGSLSVTPVGQIVSYSNGTGYLLLKRGKLSFNQISHKYNAEKPSRSLCQLPCSPIHIITPGYCHDCLHSDLLHTSSTPDLQGPLFALSQLGQIRQLICYSKGVGLLSKGVCYSKQQVSVTQIGQVVAQKWQITNKTCKY